MPAQWPHISRKRYIVSLELATLLFLAAPVVLWSLFWLRASYGYPLAVVIVAAVALAWRETCSHYRQLDDPQQPAIPLIPWLGMVALVSLWAFYSGAGGFTPFTGDWIKHFAFLRDLSENEWPVTYQAGETVSPMVYYVAYYLPAALVGKLAGWWWANFAILLWTCLGAVLCASWFTVLAGRLPLVAGVCFILANGLDFIGDRLVSGVAMQPGNVHLDWWAGFTFLNLPGHTSQLNWAPQHSFAAWAATGLLAVQLADRRGLGHAGLIAALVAHWSPFSIIGLAPFALVAVVLARGRGLLTAANLLSLPVMGAAVLFFASKANDLPSGPLWASYNMSLEWPRLLLVYLLEFGLFFMFSRELRYSKEPRLRWLFWTAGGVLLLAPLYKLGDYNDWCMRVTIPALFVLWVGVARSFVALRWPMETRVLLFVFVLGAFGAIHESARTWHKPGQPPQVIYVGRVPELQPNVARQYVADPNSFFYRHLARQGSVRVNLTPPAPPP